MNYVKIQQDIIKAVYNDKRDEWRFIEGVHNGRVWVIYKGYAIFSVPECLWFLDIDGISKKCNLPLPISERIFKSHMDLCSNSEACHFTGTRPYRDKELNRYESDYTHKEVFVDPNLLKWLDKKFDYTYRMIDKRNPLYIMDGEDMVGCVLPVNVG